MGDGGVGLKIRYSGEDFLFRGAWEIRTRILETMRDAKLETSERTELQNQWKFNDRSFCWTNNVCSMSLYQCVSQFPQYKVPFHPPHYLIHHPPLPLSISTHPIIGIIMYTTLPLFLLSLLHLHTAPHTKVEESHNLHAIHTFLNNKQYTSPDWIISPGPVDRTLIPAYIIAAIVRGIKVKRTLPLDLGPKTHERPR